MSWIYKYKQNSNWSLEFSTVRKKDNYYDFNFERWFFDQNERYCTHTHMHPPTPTHSCTEKASTHTCLIERRPLSWSSTGAVRQSWPRSSDTEKSKSDCLNLNYNLFKIENTGQDTTGWGHKRRKYISPEYVKFTWSGYLSQRQKLGEVMDC